MNWRDIGSASKTPTHRLHGRRDNKPILEFGEKILYMPANPARVGQWDQRFFPGVFVGMLNSSSDAVIVTEQGSAIKTRSANISINPESGLGMRAVRLAVTMHSTFKSEWRGPRRWCVAPVEKC